MAGHRAQLGQDVVAMELHADALQVRFDLAVLRATRRLKRHPEKIVPEVLLHLDQAGARQLELVVVHPGGVVIGRHAEDDLVALRAVPEIGEGVVGLAVALLNRPLALVEPVDQAVDLVLDRPDRSLGGGGIGVGAE